MGEAAKAVAAGQELTFHGRTFRMADFNIEMIGLMEARLQRRTVEAIERMRHSLPEVEFEEWRKATIQLIGAGKFSYGSQAMADFSFSPEGMQYGCYLQLKACLENEPEGQEPITEELAAEMWNECKDRIIALGAADPTTALQAGHNSA